jgi:hypothetical protein
MHCPDCQSPRHRRLKGPRVWRSPVEIANRTWRVHQCLECGLVFLSEQRVVIGGDAEAWADALEPTTQPPSSSDDKP